MSSTTENLNLIKPEPNEFYGVDVANQNSELIDIAVKGAMDAINNYIKSNNKVVSDFKDGTQKVANCDTADKLGSYAGSTTNPCYIGKDGLAHECSFELNKSVPSDAKFTDTVQEVVDNLTSTDVDKALSANQGRVINDDFNSRIVDMQSTVENHTKNQSNPHNITKAQLGLGNVNNTADSDKPISTAQKNAIDNVKNSIDSHLTDKGNPHGVTKSQIGLGSVNNTADTDKPVSTKQQAAIDTVQNNLNTHTGNAENPHGVTKEQVGLGQVPNVSTNNQTPTYTIASSNKALKSGESLSTAFGKIAKAISSLISHLTDKVLHLTPTERTNWNSAYNGLVHSNIFDVTWSEDDSCFVIETTTLKADYIYHVSFGNVPNITKSEYNLEDDNGNIEWKINFGNVRTMGTTIRANKVYNAKYSGGVLYVSLEDESDITELNNSLDEKLSHKQVAIIAPNTSVTITIPYNSSGMIMFQGANNTMMSAFQYLAYSNGVSGITLGTQGSSLTYTLSGNKMTINNKNTGNYLLVECLLFYGAFPS